MGCLASLLFIEMNLIDLRALCLKLDQESGSSSFSLKTDVSSEKTMHLIVLIFSTVKNPPVELSQHLSLLPKIPDKMGFDEVRNAELGYIYRNYKQLGQISRIYFPNAGQILRLCLCTILRFSAVLPDQNIV